MNFFSSKTKRIPKELRELQKSWLKGCDPFVEQWVRDMTRPEIRELGGKWLVSGKGCGGTGKIGRVDKRLRELLMKATEAEYFAPEPSAKACDRLRDFLSKQGVGLEVLPSEERGVSLEVLSIEEVPGGAFEAALVAFAILPPHHFGHDDFKTLRIERSREKPEFDEGVYCRNGKMNLSNTLVLGAKRNFLAFLLHGMGHALQCILGKDDEAQLAELSAAISPKFAVDFHLGDEARVAVQGLSPSEFIAEGYLHYVTQGQVLSNFIALQEPKQRARWEKLLEIYRKNFDGLKYA